MTDIQDRKTPSRVKSPAVVHLSVAERVQRGKVARAEVPRAVPRRVRAVLDAP